jgi:hypothetical protein
MEQATNMVLEGDFSDHILDILPSGRNVEKTT